jgi:hypothetical protein
MQLFGFDVVLPDGLRVEKRSSAEAGVCIDVVGEDVQTLLASIVDRAAGVGFSVSNNAADRVELERGEQRLILVFDSEGLTIQTYDPSVLPVARHAGSVVLLADLRVDMGSASITPLRERVVGELRRAAWKIKGATAPDAVRRVMDEVVSRRGLTRGATFGPAKGGREVWTGEASSRAELVKVRATVESDHVHLEIDLVDNHAAGRS